MKMLALLLLSPAVFAQTKSADPPLTPVPPTQRSEQSQAHDSVMKFLQGLRIAALPEGKKLQEETQWILGQADRGQYYYARPDYTDVTSVYAALFDTDIPSVQGYKEMFDMKAVTNAGTSRNLKFLAITFKDATSGKWKILSTATNADGRSLDIDAIVEFWRNRLPDTENTSPRANYAAYALWLLCDGRIKEARSALETARTVSGTITFKRHGTILKRKDTVDPVLDIQVAALLDMISKIVPNAEGKTQ
jgi:hypothetical protein